LGLSYSFDDELVTVVAVGDFDLAHVESTFSEICASFQSPSPLQILIDDSGSNFAPDVPTLRTIIHQWSTLSETTPLRIALLVTRPYHYGLGRMLDVFAEDRALSFSVFSHRDAAMDWLGESRLSGKGLGLQ
jgi:hypothetical protein